MASSTEGTSTIKSSGGCLADHVTRGLRDEEQKKSHSSIAKRG